jgi:hypothetical protein
VVAREVLKSGDRLFRASIATLFSLGSSRSAAWRSIEIGA